MLRLYRLGAAMLLAVAASGCGEMNVRYFQFDWSAKVDGRRVSVSHVVECRGVEHPHPIFFPWEDLFGGEHYTLETRQKAAMIDLPDGSRLYVDHGDRCEVTPSNATALPVVYRWFRNAPSEFIEVYFAETYYQSAAARITEPKVQVTQTYVRASGKPRPGQKLAPCPDVDPLRTLARQFCLTGDLTGTSWARYFYAQAIERPAEQMDDDDWYANDFLGGIADAGMLGHKSARMEQRLIDPFGADLAQSIDESRPVLTSPRGCGVDPRGPQGYTILRPEVRLPSGRLARTEDYCETAERSGGRPGSAAAGRAPDVVWGTWYPGY